jgi:hypothetical protein
MNQVHFPEIHFNRDSSRNCHQRPDSSKNQYEPFTIVMPKLRKDHLIQCSLFIGLWGLQMPEERLADCGSNLERSCKPLASASRFRERALCGPGIGSMSLCFLSFEPAA